MFLHKGIAYVPKINVIDILSKIFKEKLKKELMIFNEKREMAVQNDERIKVFLNQLPNQYLGKDYSENREISDKSRIKLVDLH